MVLDSGGARFAVLATDAREVAPRPDVIRLPGAPEFVTGIVNLRGTLVPLVDLGRLRGAAPATLTGWVVVLDLAGQRCAVAVDALPALRVADAPPRACHDGGADLTVCIDGVSIPLLNVVSLANDVLHH